MATKIRLKRIGRRNRPFYRLIVIDSRKKRDGAAIEQVGWFNPIAKENSYEINDERILHWLGEGAIPSDAVKKIMKQEGLSLRWHLMQQGTEEKEIEKEMKKWEMNRENVLADRDAKKLAKKNEASQSSNSEEKPAEEATAEEAPAEETPAEEALAEEAPKEEAPKDEAPKEEAPAEKEPVEEATAEEKPAEEAPAEEAPKEEAPKEEAPAEEISAEKDSDKKKEEKK